MLEVVDAAVDALDEGFFDGGSTKLKNTSKKNHGAALPYERKKKSKLGKFLWGAIIEEGGVFPAGILSTDFRNPIEGLGEVLEVGKALGRVFGHPDFGLGVGEEG